MTEYRLRSIALHDSVKSKPYKLYNFFEYVRNNKFKFYQLLF